MPITRILERLYLGIASDADRLAVANPVGISAVVNISTEKSEHKRPGLIYLHYPVRDGASVEPAVFEEVVTAIARQVQRGKVLVHCSAGMSRSPVMVAAYLRYAGHECFECALQTIAELRPLIDPNPVLVLSAKRYLRLRLKDDTSAGN
jgi:protein-tyrosine phosphatase